MSKNTLVSVSQNVTLDWVVENLGGCFLDECEQPDCLAKAEEEDVTIRFEGKGTESHYGAIDTMVEASVPERVPVIQRLRLPPETFLNVVEGWLIVTLLDGTTVKRWYEQEADGDPDWIVEKES